MVAAPEFLASILRDVVLWPKPIDGMPMSAIRTRHRSLGAPIGQVVDFGQLGKSGKLSLPLVARQPLYTISTRRMRGGRYVVTGPQPNAVGETRSIDAPIDDNRLKSVAGQFFGQCQAFDADIDPVGPRGNKGPEAATLGGMGADVTGHLGDGRYLGRSVVIEGDVGGIAVARTTAVLQDPLGTFLGFEVTDITLVRYNRLDDNPQGTQRIVRRGLPGGTGAHI
jgi:hypothetical protein